MPHLARYAQYRGICEFLSLSLSQEQFCSIRRSRENRISDLELCSRTSTRTVPRGSSSSVSSEPKGRKLFSSTSHLRNRTTTELQRRARQETASSPVHTSERQTAALLSVVRELCSETWTKKTMQQKEKKRQEEGRALAARTVSPPHSLQLVTFPTSRVQRRWAVGGTLSFLCVFTAVLNKHERTNDAPPLLFTFQLSVLPD